MKVLKGTIWALTLIGSSASAADLVCKASAESSTYGMKGQLVSASTKPDENTGFKVVIDSQGQYDIVWNTPQWDFKTLKEGGVFLRALDRSDFASSFGLAGGTNNVSYTLLVNMREDGEREYLLNVVMWVGNYGSTTETGTCRWM